MTREISTVYENLDEHVEVYFNLTRKCWSIRSVETKKVVAHTNSVHLRKASYHVNENARQRVLKTEHKTIHAFVRGFVTKVPADVGEYDSFSYNPYMKTRFTLRNGDELTEDSGGNAFMGFIGTYAKDYLAQTVLLK